MNTVDAIEFICLGCGLQGMIQLEGKFDCPKCGQRVISTLKESDASEITA